MRSPLRPGASASTGCALLRGWDDEASLVSASPVRIALARLGSYVGRNRGYYALWASLTLCYVVLFVSVPVLVGRCLHAAETFGPGPELNTELWRLAFVTLSVAVLRFFTRTMVFNAAREIEYEIRNDIFAQLQRLPQSFYFRWRTGDIMSRCVNDVNAVRLMLGVGVLNVVQTPLMYVLSIGAMAVINPTLALLVLIPYPLFILVARVLGSKLYGLSLAAQQSLASMSNLVQESIAGIAVVKAYLVARNFMHINMAPKFVTYLMVTCLVFMLLFFAGVAPDVMKDSGDNWVKPTATWQYTPEPAHHESNGSDGHESDDTDAADPGHAAAAH